MYHRYVTFAGFASARHKNRTSFPSGIRPPTDVLPPITDTETFGAYLTYKSTEKKRKTKNHKFYFLSFFDYKKQNPRCVLMEISILFYHFFYFTAEKLFEISLH